MLEILKFIFSSFWVWLGTLILICAPLGILVGVVEALQRLTLVKIVHRRAKKEKNDE